MLVYEGCQFGKSGILSGYKVENVIFKTLSPLFENYYKQDIGNYKLLVVIKLSVHNNYQAVVYEHLLLKHNKCKFSAFSRPQLLVG